MTVRSKKFIVSCRLRKSNGDLVPFSALCYMPNTCRRWHSPEYEKLSNPDFHPVAIATATKLLKITAVRKTTDGRKNGVKIMEKKMNSILTWNKKTGTFEMVAYPLPSHVLDTEGFCEATNVVLARRYTDIATCDVARNKSRVDKTQKALNDALAKWDYDSMPSRKAAMASELDQWRADIPLLTADIGSAEADAEKKRKLEKRLAQTESRIQELAEGLNKLADAQECAFVEISSLKIKLENAKAAALAADSMLSQTQALQFDDVPESATLYGDGVPTLYATLWVNVAGEDATGTKPEPVEVKGCAALYRACTDFWNQYGSTSPDEKSGDKTADWKRIRDDFEAIGKRLNGPKNDGVRKMFAFTSNKKTVNALIAFAGETLKKDPKTGKILVKEVRELDFQEQVLAHIFKCAIKIDDVIEKESRREVV